MEKVLEEMKKMLPPGCAIKILRESESSIEVNIVDSNGKIIGQTTILKGVRYE